VDAVGTLKVRDLGDYIRQQRKTAQISLRQLARQAGVSNPYLSQIERGLRKPSAEILQQIAKALRISAEALYVQAGILEEREGTAAVTEAILSDELITERQKQVLLEIYDSFRKENAARTIAATAHSLATEEGVSLQVSEDLEPVVTLTDVLAEDTGDTGDTEIQPEVRAKARAKPSRKHAG
jgi:transcriptional regulator with XRE-family HTH domain